MKSSEFLRGELNAISFSGLEISSARLAPKAPTSAAIHLDTKASGGTKRIAFPDPKVKTQTAPSEPKAKSQAAVSEPKIKTQTSSSASAKVHNVERSILFILLTNVFFWYFYSPSPNLQLLPKISSSPSHPRKLLLFLLQRQK